MTHQTYSADQVRKACDLGGAGLSYPQIRARSRWAVDVPDLATVIGTIKDRVGGPMASSGLFL